MAEPKPKYPISSAIEFNFISKGVLLSSWALSIVPRIIPFCEYSPIAIIIPVPFPSITFVPHNNILLLGFLFPNLISSKHFSNEFFFNSVDSPVNELSSIFILFPSINNISAGKISPQYIFIKSPTNKSSECSSCIIPLRIISYLVFSFSKLFKL